MFYTSIWMTLTLKYFTINHAAAQHHFVKRTDRVYFKYNAFNKWSYFLLFSNNGDKIQPITEKITKKPEWLYFFKLMSKELDISVTLKAALTLDGKIATASGHSKWITGEAARHKVHELRHQNDAVLVGINTVIADDPELTVRGIAKGNSPVRIVLDSMARIPENSRIFQNDGIPVIIATGNKALSRKWPNLPNLKILTSPTATPEITWILSELHKLGLKSLLVEGGSFTYASFLKSGAVDRLVLFVGPKIIGGQQALSWCGELGVDQLDQALQIDINSVSAVGEDFLIDAKIK